MIAAARTPLLTALWSRYVAWRLSRSFRAIWAQGALPPDEPVVLYANHTNFWDGFVAHAVIETSGRDGFVMMEEAQLERFAFLRRLGAFSVKQGSAASVRASLKYAGGLLARPRATVLVFPQGRFAPFSAKLELYPGAEVLARRAKVRCVPMALRFGLFEHEYPDALVLIGKPHPVEPTEQMAERLTALRDALARVSRPDELPLLLPGRRTLAQPGTALTS